VETEESVGFQLGSGKPLRNIQFVPIKMTFKSPLLVCKVFIILCLILSDGFFRQEKRALHSLQRGKVLPRNPSNINRRKFSSAIPGVDQAQKKSSREIIDQGRKVFQETISILRETGVRSTSQRAAQTAYAILQTSLEVVQELRETKSTASLNYAQILRRLFERLGATYVKLGQFIASSPTLFPADFVREFQKCLDQTTPVPYDKIKRIIKEELGNPDSLFSKIDPKPLASASVAQVHAATLKTGEEVVIKVLKPGVADIMKVDLGFLYASTRVLELLAPQLSRASFADIVGDIRAAMLDELDFTKEAKNINSFQSFIQQQNLGGVAVAPKVYPKYSSKRVLTMERFRGAPLVDLDAIRKYSPNPETTLINALNTWLLSVLLCESFHADVHAGNLLVLEDGRVGFIDFGIVGRIPPKIWNSIRQLAEALTDNNYQGMAEAMVSMGATDKTVNVEKFAADLEILVNKIQKIDPDVVLQAGPEGVIGQIAVDESQITDLVLQVVAVSENNGLRLPREFGLLMKQALYFDRYQKILAPGLDILRDQRIQGVIDV